MSRSASIWDVSGLLSPLQGALRDCVRRSHLETKGDFEANVSCDLKRTFINRLYQVERARSLSWPRTVITADVLSLEGDLLCFSDSSGPGGFEQIVQYLQFRRANGEFTCQFITGRNFLVKSNSSIPRSELQAASLNAGIASATKKNLSKYVKRTIGLTDSGCVIHWVHNQSKVLGLFERVRVQEIRDVFEDDFLFVPGINNPSDNGTRLPALAEQVGPDSIFFKGAPWMKKGIDNALAEGIIQTMSTFVQQKSSKVALEAVETWYIKHDLPLTGMDPVDDISCL